MTHQLSPFLILALFQQIQRDAERLKISLRSEWMTYADIEADYRKGKRAVLSRVYSGKLKRHGELQSPLFRRSEVEQAFGLDCRVSGKRGTNGVGLEASRAVS